MAERGAQFPWQELGIAPTRDRQVIRRAYAAKLKGIDPGRDPAAFRRLRAAYEAAMRAALAPVAATHETPVDEPPAPPRPDPAEPIRARLRRGDVSGAFALFQEADAAHALPFAEVRELELEMLARVAVMTTLAPDTLEQLVGRFHWDEATHPLRAESPVLFTSIDRRLDAERWYAELLARAQGPRWRLAPDTRGFAARLLLRGPPRWYEHFGFGHSRLMLGTPRHALTEVLQQFAHHEEWLAGRFDARRLRWCRRRIRPAPLIVIYIMGFGCIVPVIALVQTHDVVAPLVVVGVNAASCAIALAVVSAATRLARRRKGGH